MMFEVVVKDFSNGTLLEVITVDRYVEIIRAWEGGEDIVVDNQVIANKNIESIYSRKHPEEKTV